jgi:hypothetical protein
MVRAITPERMLANLMFATAVGRDFNRMLLLFHNNAVRYQWLSITREKKNTYHDDVCG